MEVNMTIHAMYAVTLTGLLLVVWLVAGVQPQEKPWQAGYYCVGGSDGVRVYAPGRVIEGRAVVIWADTGRLHHIDTGQLGACAQ
jgi:hypothetical protein